MYDVDPGGNEGLFPLKGLIIFSLYKAKKITHYQNKQSWTGVGGFTLSLIDSRV